MNKPLREHIHRLVRECLNEMASDVRITTLSNPVDIKKYIGRIYQIFNNSYKNVEGGLLTADKEKDLLKSTQLVKAVFDNTGDIIACATYRTRGTEGYKMGAIGCDKTKANAVIALQAIIQDDIKNYKGWYWSEVSGAVEHYFKKHGGFPIPNMYAGDILKKKVQCLEDKLHYARQIGTNATNIRVKCIYGFASEQLFNEVTKMYDNYEEFRKITNAMSTMKEAYLEHGQDYRMAILVLDNMEMFRVDEEDGYPKYELPMKWYKILEWAVKTIRSINPDDDTSYYYTDLANDLINWYEPLVLHKF